MKLEFFFRKNLIFNFTMNRYKQLFIHRIIINFCIFKIYQKNIVNNKEKYI